MTDARLMKDAVREEWNLACDGDEMDMANWAIKWGNPLMDALERRVLNKKLEKEISLLNLALTMSKATSDELSERLAANRKAYKQIEQQHLEERTQLRKDGYIVSMRLLQSDIVLDDAEQAARDMFINQIQQALENTE